MRSPLMRARFYGPFYSPLERAWEMSLQCYKPMPDDAQALIASPKLSAIYLDVPLHLFPLFPLALRPRLLLSLICPSLLFH